MTVMGCSETAVQEKRAAAFVDPSVISEFYQLNPQASHFTIFFQTRITNRYDLALVETMTSAMPHFSSREM